MRLNKRMVLMGLVIIALMTLSMTLSVARSWRTNPIFLAPGVPEWGYVTPRTYGHLIPIRPFPGQKEPGVPADGVLIPTRTPKGGGESGNYNSSSSSRVNPGSVPVPSGKSGGAGMAAGSSGMPMGNYFAGAVAVNHATYLENDLRDAIRKLNTK